MKTFNNLLEAVKANWKNVEMRGAGEHTSSNFDVNKTNEKPIGYLRTKMHGEWTIYALENWEKQWLGKNAKNAYRIANHMTQGIVKLDITKGKYAMLDNQYYEDTDKVRFERVRLFEKLIIDSTMEASQAFNFMGEFTK